MQDKYNQWRRMILAAVLLGLILMGFFVFLHSIHSRTLERNANYLADAATQTAKRIDDLLLSAENSISAVGRIYEQSLNPEQADLKMQDKLVESTVFDYIGHVNADGILTDSSGRQADASDRYYVQDGLRGNTGIDMIFNGRISGENLVIFYTPLRKGDEVVGVLTGRYRQHQMREIISSAYFGEPANTYLCLSDGTVIASSVEIQPENILDTLNQNDVTDKNALETLTDALSTRSSTSFTYTNSYGSSAAYVTKLPHCDWMLLQVFPMQVTEQMLRESNRAATYLVLWLVLLAALYVVLLLLENARQTKKLTWEKQQMREIVGTTSHLFRKFILVDLEHDAYTILEDEDQPDHEPLPVTGTYSDLRNYWLDRIVDTAAESYDKERLSILRIQEQLTEDVPYLQYEDRICGSGTQWRQISVLCLKRKHGIPTSVLVAVQDVSELKEREHRSRIALEDAYQSAQAANEAKRTFLFDMSHDMRTPLNAVIGLSSLLARDAGDPDRVRSYSRKIQASGQHLLTLVNEVLDMSKIESGRTQLNLSAFSLSELLEQLTFVFQPQAQERGQTLKINAFGVPQERLIGDKLRLNEVLGNLLSNAIKYTHPGGEVYLTVHGLAKTTQGYVHLLFEVRDNGIGMSPDFVPHVFDPFAREQNSTVSGIQGAGLGLTITKSIVDLMGGTISVNSTQGEGSTFQVELELRPAIEDGDSAFWKEQSIGKALILGSDEKICQSIQGLMEGTGVELRYAASSSAAWTLSENTAFDLILLDHSLPGVDTLEAIQNIRAHYGNAPKLILIDSNWIGKEEAARSAGANGFLPAPFAMSTLKKVVSECQRQSQSGEASASLRGLRMLVVEDNDINAEILMELLDMEGILSERTENGRVAVAEFQSKPAGYYDGVLMDIQMPEMNGYEAARAIRSLNRPDAADIPIVAMTANAFAEDVQKSMDAGMNAHLAKPIAPVLLHNTLSRLLRNL